MLVLTGLLATACGIAGGLTGRSDDQPARQAATVRLGYFPNLTHAPALVGLERGLFDARLGEDRLQPVSFSAGPDAVTALLSDAIDIAYLGPNPAVNAFVRSGGKAVRIVAGATSGGASFVVAPDIATASDLRGRTVASPQLGGSQDVALRTWLRSQGLSNDTAGGGDVSVLPRSNADILRAFQAGDLAGAWVPEPWATRLVDEAGGRVLVDERDLWPGGTYVTTHLVVRTRFLEQHPDVVRAVLEAHLDALDLLATDPDGARRSAVDAIERDTGKRLPDPVLAAAWRNLTFTPDPVATSLQTSAEHAVEVGFLEHARLAGIYDLILLNELLAARGRPEVPGP